MEIWILLGVLCVLYTLREVIGLVMRTALSAPAPPSEAPPRPDTGSRSQVEFGAVDVESARPIEMHVDRRVRDDPNNNRRRRATDYE